MAIKRMRRKVAGLFLTLCLIFTTFSTAYGATVGSDVKGHWAESQINDWIAKGLIAGYEDGSFKPDKSITRAEFIALVNRSFGFTAMDTVSFSDLKASDWEYADVQKAVKAGFISGYEDQTLRPGNPISRQEIASIVLRLLKLSPTEEGTSFYTDSLTFPAWSKGAIGAVTAAKIMKGYEDASFRPTKSTTRAEAVITLTGAIKGVAVVYDQAGTYGPATGTSTVDGNVEVSVPGVVLQNMIINGNLILSTGVGTGDVTLKNVNVKGSTVVNGGGANSIHVIDSVLAKAFVNKVDGTTVRMTAEGTTSIGDVLVESPVILEELNLTGIGFTNVTLAPGLKAGAKIVLIGNFNEVTILEANLNIELRGTIQKITVDAKAAKTALNLTQGSNVDSLILNSPITVTGPGTIKTVTAYVLGSTFETQPTTINNGSASATPAPTASPTPTTAPGGNVGGTGGGGGGSTGGGGNNGGGQNTTVTVSGYVYGSNVLPLQGVTAQVYQGTYSSGTISVPSVTTDVYGKYTISNVPTGSIYLNFNKTGFVPVTNQGAATVSTNTTLPTVTMYAIVSEITGTVVGTNNAPLNGATVTVTGTTYNDVTLPDGTFHIYNAPNGTHTLTAMQNAYQTVTTSTYTVTAGSTTSAGTIHLTPNVLLQSATVTGTTYLDVTVTQGVYGTALHNTPVDVTSFNLAISGGAATNPVIHSVTKINGAALTSGETTFRIYFTVTGTPNGNQKLILTPTNNNSVYYGSGLASASKNETLTARLN